MRAEVEEEGKLGSSVFYPCHAVLIELFPRAVIFPSILSELGNAIELADLPRSIKDKKLFAGCSFCWRVVFLLMACFWQ